ncbi:sulfite exporter TauE/SafE family protein [Sphingosinicella rhizophila]|uniref:Probable membrane transporter protein n=1 Tax=Sphingosinicella rhizophila TaxID=3050082 RepID=A0ABU3Q660_9SPHN|nr:sulfite exporter TauE/SafE family protein [Sphingosinicella sp. GR2756]MDT9598787.1 sulfite exporter TauE/SafE family protein [Sphingosinicella sp. GR2756]
MDTPTLVALALLMGVGAALYSSVGHGGASAYLALMAMFGISTEIMRPTALTLNLLVAGIATIGYARAGKFNLRLLLAFSATAIPCAFVGGMIHLSPEIYRPLVGITLWVAALRLAWRPRQSVERPVRPPPLLVSLPCGALLGLLAGLTGTGGGIFLSPLILLFGWEEPRKTSGVAAAFILANSAAGLAGNLSSVGQLPSELPILLMAVGIGALAGIALGIRKLPQIWLLRLLALVLLIAGGKLIFT